jgi:hypothetical protein
MGNGKAKSNDGKYFNEDILIVCISEPEDQAGYFCQALLPAIVNLVLGNGSHSGYIL